MSETNDEWISTIERTHEAVRKFSRREFSTYARKVTYRMRRFSASGIYGDDLKHKTLWDEYCYEQHNGPTEALLTAWDETLRSYFDEVLKSIPADTAILLSIYSVWELEGPLEICGSIWSDGIKEVLEGFLVREAMNETRKHF